jgi:glycosyltransferase involved in cell wall biosynthesis
MEIQISRAEEIRVVHAVPYFAPAFCYGGPPRSVFGLCQGLQRNGVAVEVVTTTANGRGELETSPPGGTDYQGVRVHYTQRRFPRRMFRSVGFRARLHSLIRTADIVHIHGLWNFVTWTAAEEARRAGVPYVISPRGMLDQGSLAHHSWRKRLAYALLERRHLAGAALLHATSEREAAGFAAINVPVSIIPNGINTAESHKARAGRVRRSLGIPADAFVVLFLGRVHPIKRLDLLGDAVRLVWRRDSNVHLVVAGPCETCHRRAIEGVFYGAPGIVHWTGEVEDDVKETLLTEVDALVMCSDSESFGMSVLEALSAGVPVVVTQTCPWEVVVKAQCGFWVPQTAETIAEALGWLICHRDERRAMGHRGRELARLKYDWGVLAGAMAARYRMIVDDQASLLR